MCVMSEQILDCLKRKRDICIKNIIPSQNTAFRWTPALICLFLPSAKLSRALSGSALRLRAGSLKGSFDQIFVTRKENQVAFAHKTNYSQVPRATSFSNHTKSSLNIIEIYSPSKIYLLFLLNKKLRSHRVKKSENKTQNARKIFHARFLRSV